jgi:SWIRM domain
MTSKEATSTTVPQRDETNDLSAAVCDRLRRNTAAGMDAAFLQTNFYGPGNKKIKHCVHRGALHLPDEVLARLAPPDQEYDLPGLDFVARPSLDDSRKQVVAQVRFEERLEDVVVDGVAQKRPVSRILITNEFLKKPGAKRIRGGGGEGGGETGPPGSSAANAMDVDTVVPTAPAGAAVAAAVAPTSTTTSNDMTSASINLAVVATASGGATPLALAQQPPPLASLNTNPFAAQSDRAQLSAIAPLVAQSSAPAIAPLSGTETSAQNDVVRPACQPSVSNEIAPPETTSSSTTAEPKSEEPKAKDPKVVPLENRPSSQWEKRKPTKEELPPDALKSSPRPEWYKEGEASDLEKALLPEWFDDSARHRTPVSYVQAREKMILMASQLGENRYLTGTMVRRAIPGDAASLLRLHDLLTSHGIINENAVNDTQPSLRVLHTNSTQTTRDNIVKAVVQQLRTKKPWIDPAAKGGSIDSLEVNWDDVAAMVGDGLTAASCERTFMDMTTSNAAAGDSLLERDSSSLADLLAKCKPHVFQSATIAAVAKSDSIVEARTAAAAASIVENSRNAAQSHEVRLAHILGQTLDTRMKRLEDRLSMIEEVEGCLDAERIALNLERRDLYTARCRHWFNGT